MALDRIVLLIVVGTILRRIGELEKHKTTKLAGHVCLREMKERLRRVFLRGAFDLANEDEAFRRDLLNELRKRGRGKRGRQNARSIGSSRIANDF